MTGGEFRAARESLGLSVRGLATALGLAPTSARNIRRYEHEGPPPLLEAKLRLLLAAPRPMPAAEVDHTCQA